MNSSGNSFSRFPRLKIVTSWPRASAAATVLGPRKPVPPRIKMRFLTATGVAGAGPVPGPGVEAPRDEQAEATPRAPSARPPRKKSRRWRSER